MAQQPGVAHATLAEALWSPEAGSNTFRAVVLAVIGSISEAVKIAFATVFVPFAWQLLKQS